MKLFLSPHNDDETLFGALTIMREKPLVVVVYDGYVQANRGVNVTAAQRREESRRAMIALGQPEPHFLGLRDDQSYTPHDMVFRLSSSVDVDQEFDAVYAPMYDDDGHAQHNLVALAAADLKSPRHVDYSTYTRSGGRQRTLNEVPPECGEQIRMKHLALLCYASQMNMDPRLGCWPHFMSDLREYVA